MIKDLKDLDTKLMKEWAKLDDARDYLNEAGMARMEALRNVMWHIPFFDSLLELYNSEELSELILLF